ncbi:hypothetical protein ACSYAD_30695 [Acaryochloris marina NIES-2412]|uniref:hypothetical protein n=1 Tax=Acaryochloris marina TaxID=155978 RepID=UPI004057EF33
MLKTFLSRLWQQVTQVFVRPQADEPVDEAEEFKKFYRKELIKNSRELGYDIQPVEDEPEINHMNTAVWVGSSPVVKKLGTKVNPEDFEVVSRGEWPSSPNDISALEQFEENPKLKEAYQKAVEAYRKEAGR